MQQNIIYSVKDGKLIIEIDLNVDLGPSSTGRSNFVAKTDGWMRIPELGEGFMMNLNLVDFDWHER